MTRPTRKFAISDFKGIVGKVAQELVSNQSGIDISNFDFRHAGALNLRRGIKDCVSGLGAIKGLKRYYSSTGLRKLFAADTVNMYDVNTVACTSEKINIFNQGKASVDHNSAIVTIGFPLGSNDTGFISPTEVIPTTFNVLNENNTFFEDGIRATVRDDTNQNIAGITVGKFNLASHIPEGATIDGFEIKIKGFKTTSDSLITTELRIIDTVEGLLGTPFSPINFLEGEANESTFVSGGPTFDFGLTVTRDDVIKDTFGLRYLMNTNVANSLKIEVDFIAIKVHFSGGTGDAGLTLNVKPGDRFLIDDDGTEFTILSVDSDVQITLTTTFVGGTHSGTAIDFVDSNPDTIILQSGSWITKGFIAGMELVILNAGTPANNGTFTIDNITTTTNPNDTLVLASGDSITADTGDSSAILTGNFVEADYTIIRVFNNNDKLDLVLVQSKNRLYGTNGADQPFEWDGGISINDIGLDVPDPLTAIEGIAGSVPDGTYKYVVTFVSEFGESNPSTETSVTVSSGPSQIDLTLIDIGVAKVTARNIFRTPANGTDFFLLTQITDNTTTVFTDNVTDDVLIANQVLFSPFDHDKPPVLKYIEWHKNHLFGAEVDSNIIRFSDLDFPDHWPAFNQFRTLSGENVERIASLGDLLVIFTRNTVQILRGDNEETFLLQGIETSFGLTAPFSVADVPANSLFYLSQTGVRQFGGQASPRISDPIERLLFDEKSKHRINKDALNKVCAIHTDDKFYMLYPRKKTTTNDAILVFDFLTKDWYILDISASAIESFDGVGDQNEIFIGTETGEVKQIETGQDDNGDKIEAKYTTRYINMGSHDLKYFVNIFLKVFATGTADVILIASTESRPGTVDKAFLNLRDISRGQDLFWSLPNDMKGEGIQIRIAAKGTNEVRIERMVIEHANQPEADNAKDDG